MAHDASEHAQASQTGEAGGISTGVAILGFVLCFLAGGLFMWAYDKKVGGGSLSADNSSVSVWSDEEASIPVSSKDPMWGNREAPVTIVVFSDFQCPFCSRVEATLDQVKTTYGKDKVRILWKNKPLPFHKDAKPAAEAAAGVFALGGNDAFWKFHATAFKNQSALTADNFEKWAKEAGIKDIAKFKKGLADHTWAKKVEDDDQGAGKVGVSGTPASFVNGVLVSGAQPIDKFKATIDAELKKAQDLLAKGTPKGKLYIAASKENFKGKPAAAEDDEEKEDSKTVWKMPLGKSPVRGSATALVTIVEFSDFECPFCKRVEPTLQEVQKKYGDKVRIAWKHLPLPFHKHADPAAQLTFEALAQKGNKGFWDAHDKLYESQPKLEDADLETIAKDLGLDVAKVKDAIAKKKYKKEIREDMKVAKEFNAQGTPHFFINGRRISGAQPLENFTKIIDEEVTRAEAMAKKGLKGDALYEALIADGKAGAPAAAPEKKDVKLDPKAPWKGAANAKVVIQEFSDFQCPFCKRVEPTVSEVMKKYGDRVKLVWRHLPLPMHPDAPLASEATIEAHAQKGNDGFWKMHAKLFENQQNLKRENLDKAAEELKLDMAKFKAALDNHTHAAAVEADKKTGNDAGISGTPAFVINGYFLSGAQPLEEFEEAIERALAEAK